MPTYRYKDANGSDEDIMVIEDKSMFVRDRDGSWAPGFEFIDAHTVRAHPYVIDTLLLDAERLWTLEEILAGRDG